MTTHKRPILNSTEIEAMTTTLGISPPEMIFGNNSVEVTNEKLNWSISFNALDALELVDKSGDSMLKVSYSEAWQKMRERVHEDIKEIVKPYDWTYTTNYQGTVYVATLNPCAMPLFMDNLRRKNANAIRTPLGRSNRQVAKYPSTSSSALTPFSSLTT